MSRRTLCLFLVLCLLSGLLAGCGAKEESTAEEETFGSEVSPSPAPAAQSAVEDQNEAPTTGSFSMPYNESYGWNPYTCTGMENRAVMQLIYEGLFTMNGEFDPEPMLCKSYQVSEDGLVYTLELQSASFSNGSVLSADDVIYSMQQAEASELFSSRFRSISSYYASGTSAVTVELDYPNDRLPCLLTFPIVPSYSAGEAPPGTGPFVRSASNVLTLNTQWWQNASTLNFQTVTLFSSVSAEDTRDNFEIDNVQFVYNNPSASSAATFHCDYELWNSRSTVMQYIGFNFSSGVFSDKEVRAEITHAIDRLRITESVYHNFADAAVLPVHPSSSMYDEDLADRFAFTSAYEVKSVLTKTDSFYLPDNYQPANGAVSPAPSENTDQPETASPEEAEDMEAEEPEDEESEPEKAADGSKDKPETYNNIVLLVQDGNLNRTAAAKLVAQNLEDVGFTVETKLVDADDFADTLYELEWDIYYGEVTLTPDFDLRSLLSPGGSLCFGDFSGSDELESLLYDSMENSGNRYDLYECILENGYLCPVLFINNAVFTTRGLFTGLAPSPDHLFYQIKNIHVNQG